MISLTWEFSFKLTLPQFETKRIKKPILFTVKKYYYYRALGIASSTLNTLFLPLKFLKMMELAESSLCVIGYCWNIKIEEI